MKQTLRDVHAVVLSASETENTTEFLATVAGGLTVGLAFLALWAALATPVVQVFGSMF